MCTWYEQQLLRGLLYGYYRAILHVTYCVASTFVVQSTMYMQTSYMYARTCTMYIVHVHRTRYEYIVHRTSTQYIVALLLCMYIVPTSMYYVRVRCTSQLLLVHRTSIHRTLQVLICTSTQQASICACASCKVVLAASMQLCYVQQYDVHRTSYKVHVLCTCTQYKVQVHSMRQHYHFQSSSRLVLHRDYIQTTLYVVPRTMYGVRCTMYLVCTMYSYILRSRATRFLICSDEPAEPRQA